MLRQKKKLVVVGQGYVGLPLALLASKVGYDVVGLETNEAKVRAISSCSDGVAGVATAEMSAALDSGRFTVTSDLGEASNFDFAVITVPTPLQDGIPDLSFVREAARGIGGQLSPGATVILESTTYPGTTEEILAPLLEEVSGFRVGRDFQIGYSPERIDPGNEVWNLENTPKIVSGINQESLRVVGNFYRSLGITCVEATGTREAELTKLLENTFRHVNIALVNELSCFADVLEVDLWEAIELASTKPFGFMKFYPGPGVGGHCLPVDPSYLSWAVRNKAGRDFQFINLANEVNASMPEVVVQRLISGLGVERKDLTGMKVLLIGLSYKKNVGDVREAPSIKVAHLLNQAGATVHGLDSHVSIVDWPLGIHRVKPEELGRYRVGILMTPHSDLTVPSVLQQCDFIVDTQNAIPSIKE